MSSPRFDARALAQAGLTRDQIRMLESLFKDTQSLALIQVVLATANPLFPSGRVLTDTATVDIDTATAGQIKAWILAAAAGDAKAALLLMAEDLAALAYEAALEEAIR